MSKVLIIDDDPDTAEGMQLMFARRGHDVTSLENGWAALIWLTEAAPLPDVIVLDWMMPQMDGGDVLQAIRSEPTLAAVAVVVFSAAPDRVADAIALGASAYVVKGSMSWDSMARRVEWLLLELRSGSGGSEAEHN